MAGYIMGAPGRPYYQQIARAQREGRAIPPWGVPAELMGLVPGTPAYPAGSQRARRARAPVRVTIGGRPVVEAGQGMFVAPKRPAVVDGQCLIDDSLDLFGMRTMIVLALDELLRAYSLPVTGGTDVASICDGLGRLAKVMNVNVHDLTRQVGALPQVDCPGGFKIKCNGYLNGDEDEDLDDYEEDEDEDEDLDDYDRTEPAKPTAEGKGVPWGYIAGGVGITAVLIAGAFALKAGSRRRRRRRR